MSPIPSHGPIASSEGKAQGMFSCEDSLATLVKEGKGDPEEARMRSARPD